MSTKDWKNGELKSLLSEAWGFKMDLSKLNEKKELEEITATGRGYDPGETRKARRVSGERGEEEDCDVRTDPTCPPEPSPKAREDLIAKRMKKEDLNESAGDAAVRKRCGEDGSGCTAEEAQAIYNKAEYGSGDPGSAEGGSLEEAHDKDWGMGKDEESRTHPGEEDYTGHKGDESHTHPGEEDYEGGEERPEDLASELLALAHRMGNALGVESDVSTMDDDEEMEDLDEGEGDRKDEREQGRDAAREHRPGSSGKLSEAQMRKLVRRVLKHELKNKKG